MGIEPPNENRDEVLLREIISNENFAKKDIRLPIALGKSISCRLSIGDLTSMPHLLIAGIIRSGKSVSYKYYNCLFVYKLSPEH